MRRRSRRSRRRHRRNPPPFARVSRRLFGGGLAREGMGAATLGSGVLGGMLGTEFLANKIAGKVPNYTAVKGLAIMGGLAVAATIAGGMAKRTARSPLVSQLVNGAVAGAFATTLRATVQYARDQAQSGGAAAGTTSLHGEIGGSSLNALIARESGMGELIDTSNRFADATLN